MILAILQARFSSSRLPGKVLKKIAGKEMLAFQVERILRSQKIEKLIVATSVEKSDNLIVLLCKQFQVACFRGDLDNVLSRFYHAAVDHNPNHIVRLTGDCPLVDPAIIDKIIEYHLKNNFDYTSNTIEPTFPDGLDVEVMKFSALKEAYENARLPSQLEHVTPFIHKQPEKFRLGSYKNDIDLSVYRWTVDEQIDFDLIAWIYDKLYQTKPDFEMRDILLLLERYPEKKQVNKQFKRNAGMQKSFEKDRDFLLENFI